VAPPGPVREKGTNAGSNVRGTAPISRTVMVPPATGSPSSPSAPSVPVAPGASALVETPGPLEAGVPSSSPPQAAPTTANATSPATPRRSERDPRREPQRVLTKTPLFETESGRCRRTITSEFDHADTMLAESLDT